MKLNYLQNLKSILVNVDKNTHWNLDFTALIHAITRFSQNRY